MKSTSYLILFYKRQAGLKVKKQKTKTNGSAYYTLIHICNILTYIFYQHFWIHFISMCMLEH